MDATMFSGSAGLRKTLLFIRFVISAASQYVALRVCGAARSGSRAGLEMPLWYPNSWEASFASVIP
jgi:hypothetical protein